MSGWRLLLLSTLLLSAATAQAAGYDAIAIDDNLSGAKGNGDYAVGQGASARKAQRIAMSNCTAGGNVACRVRLTYRQCRAYAASSRKSGTGLAADQAGAVQSAMTSCGEAACKLVVADCVDQPLQPPR